MAGPSTRNNPGNKGKAKAVPEDPDALGDEGVAQAEREQGQPLPASARTIARHLEIRRDLDWSLDSGDQVTRSWWQRLALVLQRRGDVSEPGCERCQEEDVTRGIFTSCVSAPALEGKAFQNGACANCIWVNRGRTCSGRHGGRALDGETLRQWLQDGEESLRTAITKETIQNTEIEEEYIETDHDEDETEHDENEENIEPQPCPQQEQRQQQQPHHEYANADTFFGAFTPGSPFARVGHSQRGPRCFFDGTELRFPISREIWQDRARLAVARSDLAHFAAIIDARLFEKGSGEGGNDYLFWNREARRLPGLYPLPGGWRQRGLRSPTIESGSESSDDGGPDDDGNGGAQIKSNNSSEGRERQTQPGPSGYLRAPVQTTPGIQRSPARDPRPQARRREAEATRQSQQSMLGPLPEIPDSQPQQVEDSEPPIIVVTEGTTIQDIDAAIWANAPRYGLRNYLDRVNHNVEPEEAEAARQYYEWQYARIRPQFYRLPRYTQDEPAAEQRYSFPVQSALAYPDQQDYHRAQPTYPTVTHNAYPGYERYQPMYPQSQPHPYSDVSWRQNSQVHAYPPPPEPQPRQYPPHASPILWGQRGGPFRHPRTPTPIPRPDQIHPSLRPVAEELIPDPKEKPASDPLPVQQSIEYSDNSEEQEQEQNQMQDEHRPHVPQWQLAQGWHPTRNENEPRVDPSRQEKAREYPDEFPETQQEQQEEDLPDYEDEEQLTLQEESNTQAAQVPVERQDSQSGTAPTFSSFRHERTTASPATTDDNRSPSHSPSYQGNRPTGIKQPTFDLTAIVQAEARGVDREQASVERADQGLRSIAASAVDRSFGSTATSSGVRKTARTSMYRSRNRDEEAEGDERPIKRRRTSNEEE
ncbi:DUF3716 domain-containing protein [Aspergillus stella-maris]|uniref:DUF3716 domain-containing protein n=1 Tax=Aspergillus stella-maris TaxID=1810926 RepID=UPI003CCD8573